jgi:superfamily II DNA/RNA helicase
MMEHHVLVMHPGDKDLITAQIAACNGKTILFVKTQRGADRLADNLAKAGVPVGALHGGKSQAVRIAHSNYLKSKKTQLSLQQTSLPAVSTSMASLPLSI